MSNGTCARTATAVVQRAEDWYGELFVSTKVVETSYRITLPSDEDVKRAGALSPLATLPLWSWVTDRLEVIEAALHQALQPPGHVRGLVAVSPAPPCRRLG